VTVAKIDLNVAGGTLNITHSL